MQDGINQVIYYFRSERRIFLEKEQTEWFLIWGEIISGVFVLTNSEKITFICLLIGLEVIRNMIKFGKQICNLKCQIIKNGKEIYNNQNYRSI